MVLTFIFLWQHFILIYIGVLHGSGYTQLECENTIWSYPEHEKKFVNTKLDPILMHFNTTSTQNERKLINFSMQFAKLARHYNYISNIKFMPYIKKLTKSYKHAYRYIWNILKFSFAEKYPLNVANNAWNANKLWICYRCDYCRFLRLQYYFLEIKPCWLQT